MSASPSLGLVLALAAALFIGALLGQRVPPRRLVWWGVVGVCWLFSVAMLWVTFSMSVMLWSSTAMASAAPAPTAAAAPAASSASAAGGDAGSSAIANAMTAIGVTVAVVTLILSLGTSWFGQQMERVAKLEKKLKSALDKAEQRTKAQLRLWEQTTRVDSACLAAKVGLAEHFSAKTDGTDYAAKVLEWSFKLEALRLDDSQARLNAFYDLQVLNEGRQPSDSLPTMLAPVHFYAEQCHELALCRLQQQVNDGTLKQEDMQRQIRTGLWCCIFDEAEQARFFAAMHRGS